jgi:uroporphyrinogen III methyltransferase / synthase
LCCIVPSHPHKPQKTAPFGKQNQSARVFLVGAGPGEPGLLTLRGAEVLAAADVVLYDGLSNQAILRHAAAAQHICVGKHGKSRIWLQHEINEEILLHARAGKVVVRLKGGDPAIFARTAEEVDTIRQAGIPFEIVPGITAALAAGSFAGIPITHRAMASAVALVTGHEEPGKPESALDWHALARFPGTLIVYMGVTTAEAWTSALIRAGKSPETPAAILRRCSLPDQQTVLCRLDEVATHLTPASKMRPPVIVIIGAVAQLAQQGSWFSDRPLFGKSVLVTRAEEQTDELSTTFQLLGAETLLQPAIHIEPAAFPESLHHAIGKRDAYDWLVFTSRNAVRFFFSELEQMQLDTRHFANVKFAVVGNQTANQLRSYGIRADLIGDPPNAEGLLKTFSGITSLQRILWPRASRGPDNLARGLRSQNHQVTEVVAYQHSDVAHPTDENLSRMNEARIDWTTVTSSAIARSLFAMFGSALANTKLVSLSGKTSATLRELGFPPIVEAETASMESLAQAVLRYELEIQAEA